MFYSKTDGTITVELKRDLPGGINTTTAQYENGSTITVATLNNCELQPVSMTERVAASKLGQEYEFRLIVDKTDITYDAGHYIDSGDHFETNGKKFEIVDPQDFGEHYQATVKVVI